MLVNKLAQSAIRADDLLGENILFIQMRDGFSESSCACCIDFRSDFFGVVHLDAWSLHDLLRDSLT